VNGDRGCKRIRNVGSFNGRSRITQSTFSARDSADTWRTKETGAKAKAAQSIQLSQSDAPALAREGAVFRKRPATHTKETWRTARLVARASLTCKGI
jgi:hypothetical protein